MVTVEVHNGTSALEKFQIHENLVCAKSDFFRKAYQGQFKESFTKTVDFVDEPDIFAKFVEWIYTEDYRVTPMRELDELIRVYILGDKIQATCLKDETIDKLMSFAKTGGRQQLGAEHIRMVFSKTFLQSKLRDWVVNDAFSNGIQWSNQEFFGLSEDHSAFFFDIAKFLFANSPAPVNIRGPGDTSYKFVGPSNCHFHEHKKGASCKFQLQEQANQKRKEYIEGEVKRRVEAKRKKRNG